MTELLNELTQIVGGSPSGGTSLDSFWSFARPIIIIILGIASTVMARQAKKNTENISNGFAAHTKDSLGSLVDEMKTQTEALGRIERRQDSQARRMKAVEVRMDKLSDN